jgi:hypothetical protein
MNLVYGKPVRIETVYSFRFKTQLQGVTSHKIVVLMVTAPGTLKSHKYGNMVVVYGQGLELYRCVSYEVRTSSTYKKIKLSL